MNLVIVESPAKCQKIQGFLGQGWKVIASMGHIRALEESLDSIGLDRDFEPRFQFLKEKGKALQNIKESAKGVKQVFLAADDDREGEAIAYSVALYLNLPLDTTPRSVFHEITETAVKEAIRNPRSLDMNRVYAQQARAILDLMVGFTISPLLWRHVGKALSAGRCQTPALRLVFEKEQAIRSFKASTSWKITGNFNASGFPGRMIDDLEEEEDAKNYLENIHTDATALITSAITKPWSESAPKPLITSTLQQEASALYRSNPKSTMTTAQRLYEAGHITYMRTDKAILCEEAINEARKYVENSLGKEYLGLMTSITSPTAAKKEKVKVKEKEKEKEEVKAQEAHEAIRPTHFELITLPEEENWSAIDNKIYQLIWRRAVQSIMASAKGEIRTVIFKIKEDPNEFPWSAIWKRTTFQGWKKLGTTAKLDEDADTDEVLSEEGKGWAIGAALKEGDTLRWTSLQAQPQTTKAAGRFSEATLVRELEKKGIGRPSTFASLLASIQDKKYVEKKDTPARKFQITKYAIGEVGQWPPVKETMELSQGAEKDKLAPTDLGERVLKFCIEKFHDLFDYGFTAHMESRLDAVSDGKETWKKVVKDTWDSYKERYETLKTEETALATTSAFENGIKAVRTKKGPLLLRESPDKNKDKTVFIGWPEGVKFEEITADAAAAFEAKMKEKVDASAFMTLDGQAVYKKSGKFGTYAEWNSVKVTLQGTESTEDIEALLRAKNVSSGPLHTIGDYEFRKGPYGKYMYNIKLKTKAFVSIPEALDPKALTKEAAEQIYKNGIELKKKAASFRGGRGGRGGRGRGGRGSDEKNK